MRIRRWIQAGSLILFLALLWLAAFPYVSPVPADLFLRMDPLILTGTALAGREWVAALWPALAFLALTPVLGRFFCGSLCPLGVTLDLTDRMIRPPAAAKRDLKHLKHYLLWVILGAGVFGVSLVFLASPLSLVTRFYGLLLYPIADLLSAWGLTLVRPLADVFDLTVLVYARGAGRVYAHQWITAALFGLAVSGALAAPRFFCRYVCPAGALFSLFSRKPFIRREVTEDCTGCGLCQKKCPMNAIGDIPSDTDHGECVVCETCRAVCPTDAVRFRFREWGPGRTGYSPGRRKLLTSGLSGAALALVCRTSLSDRKNDLSPGQIHPPELIRPPGAVPEKDFLRRCIRCGECMKACPTNTLQPVAGLAGLVGFWSPVITPRRGPCEPLCAVCGQVCPTGAIRSLSPEEKVWAKVGTAHVLRHKCLAWEFDRRCLVCDEVCPYNAIELRPAQGLTVAVPFIVESRCSGCGFCEHYCPVQAGSAIVVEPMEAIRLASGSYEETARQAGIHLRLTQGQVPAGSVIPSSGENPGKDGLPPGFTE